MTKTFNPAITQSSAAIYAHSDEELGQHGIRIGRAQLDAFRDRNNFVYWPLPGSRRTYDKQQAIQAAKRINRMTGGDT
ncbi:hypothetical protein [Oceanospirillum sediminis]|uniref:Uncharacterized protein n=1 Tax=Oceanospirillum sediminis TaxID=2760088 RepID=A0A839IUD7_9GAMM|nr:hypothetical protein [Oceanospirillum sediminis]MBB1489063.1 hypothetical protein [Oceanospirillum sediminis]